MQWLARLPGTQEIRGSSPGRGMTDFCTSIFIGLDSYILISFTYLDIIWIYISRLMTSLLKLENYRMFIFWLSLPVHSGSLKRIDYPKQICLIHPLSFECFHCS